MNPCELNALIAGIANYLYGSLSEKDFLFVKIFLSELSKTMFSMELLRGICRLEEDKPDSGKVCTNRPEQLKNKWPL